MVETDLGEVIIFFRDDVNFCYVESREVLWETYFYGNIYYMNNIYYIKNKNSEEVIPFEIKDGRMKCWAMKPMTVDKENAKEIRFKDFQKIIYILDLVK
jgi:hypothetical protein